MFHTLKFDKVLLGKFFLSRGTEGIKRSPAFSSLQYDLCVCARSLLFIVTGFIEQHICRSFSVIFINRVVSFLVWIVFHLVLSRPTHGHILRISFAHLRNLLYQYYNSYTSFYTHLNKTCIVLTTLAHY